MHISVRILLNFIQMNKIKYGKTIKKIAMPTLLKNTIKILLKQINFKLSLHF